MGVENLECGAMAVSSAFSDAILECPRLELLRSPCAGFPPPTKAVGAPSPGSASSTGLSSEVSSRIASVLPTRAPTTACASIIPAGSVGAARSVGGQNQFLCSRCKQHFGFGQKTAGRCECKRCGASYKSLRERFCRDRKNNIWWDKKNDDEKMAWFVQQHTVPQGTRRSFDEVMYEEETATEQAIIKLIPSLECNIAFKTT